MHQAKPSRTAWKVALRRAAHQLLDRPPVFDDPLALAIVGREAALEYAASPESELSFSRHLRAFIAVRSRYAEDELAQAVHRGVRQYVVLGAGLDTFAYRNPHAAAGLRVFEVDHPATQEWKRERLRAAQIAIAPEMVFAPVDFERQTPADGLRQTGLRMDDSAFCAWLGVVPYLTAKAFEETIAFIGALPEGSGVVFDYTTPRSSLSGAEAVSFDAMAARVAAAGEPFQLFFEPTQLAASLAAAGFRQIEDLATDSLNARYFHGRTDGLGVAGRAGHLLAARV
jgi:methyltransferase (TIGR00027 family)